MTTFDWVAVSTCMLFVASAVAVCQLLNHSTNTFSPKKDRIEVLNSKFATHVTKYGTNIVITGVLTNSSIYAWGFDGLEDMEVRFFDKDGKIVDSGKTYWGDPITMMPRSEHSFRAYLGRTTIPEYASYQIHVLSAKDPNALR